MIVVAGAVLVLGYLALRQMTTNQQQAFQKPAPSATTGRDPSMPIVPQVPSQIVVDAGKPGIARVDLVLRVDGVDVSSEGALSCRSSNKTLVGREPGGVAGTFDERALSACITSLLPTFADRKPVALVTRAGDAVPKTHLEALVAAVKRAGISEVILSP
jgi:hypothetical protein